MKTIITGATGLIGSHLAAELISDPDNYVVAVSRSEKKLQKTFSKFVAFKNFEYIVQDFSEPFAFSDIAGKNNSEPVDLIFHAAGPISGAVISNYPLSVIFPNIFALKTIFDGVVHQQNTTGAKCRVIVFSSATVYGEPKGENDVTVCEADTESTYPLDGGNAPYAESKRMAEVLTRSYINEKGVDAVIVRPSYVYGDCVCASETAFYSFLEKAWRGENIILNKSGLGRRGNIFVDDVVSGLLTVARKGISGEAYNISSNGELGNFAAIDEIAEIVAKVANNTVGGYQYSIKSHHQTSEMLALNCRTKNYVLLAGRLRQNSKKELRKYLANEYVNSA